MAKPAHAIRRIAFSVVAVWFAISAWQAPVGRAADPLAQEFQSPPRQYRLYVWWHWMGYTISRYGIRRDLHAMKQAGVAGATICPIGSQANVAPDITNAGVSKPVAYWSPRFWRLVKYAVKIAHGLHMKIGMENCPGWSASGGPWITPRLSMKMVTTSVTIVRGPGVIRIKLPQPSARLHFYRPIEVLALPDTSVVQPSGEINLSGDMQRDGELKWNAPPGRWKIFRIGYTSTASTDHPVPDSLVGPHGTVHSLEADKLSAKAARFHIEHVIDALKRHLGSSVGRTFNHLLFDSYEAGPQNWTKHFRRDFIELRHYDPLPWLPVLSGQIIGSRQLSQRFRFDMARTVSQLFVRNDFDVYRRLIDAAHMKMCLEPYTGPFNTIAAAASCDVTMGEFWNASRTGIAWNVAGAARAWGRRLVGAETLTGSPGPSRLTETPRILKKALDGGFLSGVNQCYLHDWTEQALNKRYCPGVLMGWWGTHFGENQTWFRPGITFFTYMNRCQTMLQQGSQVCNICTLNYAPPALAIDALSRMLFQQATVKNGKIVLPDGRAYDVLLLPDSSYMLPRTARKLQQLIQSGATAIGPRPLGSPSLTDYTRCDTTVAAIGRAVWGDCDGVHVKEHHYGKGLVAWNVPLPEMLAQLGVKPAFSVIYPAARLRIISAVYAAPGHGRKVNVTAMLRKIVRADGGNHIHLRVDNNQFGGDPAFGYYKWLTVKYRYGGRVNTVRIHENDMLSIPSINIQGIERRTPHRAIFFVANRSSTASSVMASFHVVGQIPELWYPDTGRRVTSAEFSVKDGCTMMPLHLQRWGSVFVVFHRPMGRFAPIVAVTRNGRPSSARLILRRSGSVLLIANRSGTYGLRTASGVNRSVRVGVISAPITIRRHWTLNFHAAYGAIPSVHLKKLVSWTQLPRRSEKYFSGTGVYRTTVNVGAQWIGRGRRIILHLGAVDDLAQVWVNGRNMGSIWHPPFDIGITSAAKPGVNHIRIAVTDTWVNRIIGDEHALNRLKWGAVRSSGATYLGRPLRTYPQWVIRNQPLPEGLHTFATWNYYRTSSHLLPAGLLGPVELRMERIVTVRGMK